MMHTVAIRYPKPNDNNERSSLVFQSIKDYDKREGWRKQTPDCTLASVHAPHPSILRDNTKTQKFPRL